MVNPEPALQYRWPSTRELEGYMGKWVGVRQGKVVTHADNMVQAMWGSEERHHVLYVPADSLPHAYARAVAERTRQETADKIAYEILRELVCCYEFEEQRAEGFPKGYKIKHPICYWGEAARQIALEVGRGERDE